MAEGFDTVSIIGGGAWGSALASVAARAGRRVTLWAREKDVVEAVNARHENTRFLPGVTLPAGVRASSDLEEAVSADCLFLVTPAQHTRDVLKKAAKAIAPETPLVIASKGIERGTNALLSDVVAQTVPQVHPAVLSGPSFAADVARGLPTAVTLAAADKALGERLVETIGLATFRPYLSDDVIGAQVGGATKNVLAIACGIVEGKRFGDSARAALTARGFAELSRLGEALGGKPETMAGLSGLGDLILTCSSAQSRNFSLGEALGKGESLEAILQSRQSVSEGVHTAAAALALAKRNGVSMPIAEQIAKLAAAETSVDEAIETLLARPFTTEA